MPLGPVTIYDKSALESLSADESVWFGNFYRATVTPIFFVETLADLEKEVARGRTPESVVGSIAAKSVLFGPDVNVHHGTLCTEELLGYELEMRGVPVVSGGRSFQSGDRRGVLLDQSLEADALQRWQEGKFLEVERSFARIWRAKLSGLDLNKARRQFKSLGLGKIRVRDLAEAKGIVDELLNTNGWQGNALSMACEALSLPSSSLSQITARWRRAGCPILPRFAPYTAHVLAVDLFFYLGLLAGQISGDRPSNRVDISYLYYLPFCMIFTSKDNLHARSVPLFLKKDQEFLRADELKTECGRLDSYFSTLPEEVRQQGVMRFAHYPPTEGGYLTARLWDHFLPKWRENAPRRHDMSEEGQARLLAELKQMTRLAKQEPYSGKVDLDAADVLIVERFVGRRMGKWQLVPPNVANTSEED
jgi:hypothetical protein